jgi:hypothetical protein
MRSRPAILVLLLAAVAAAGVRPLRAQSLADVARQEAERRKAIKEGARVYTNKDLPVVPAPAAQPVADQGPGAQAADANSAAGAADAKAAPADAKDAGQPADKDAKDQGADSAKGVVKDQAYWSGRMKSLQVQLDRDQTYAGALQVSIDALTADFVNRDDPAQRAAVSASRQKSLAELDRLKKAIEADKKAVADLEEEARRAGAPPGWLRS